MHGTFSPREMIRFGWSTFTKRPWFFMGAYAFSALLYVVADSVVSSLVPPHDGSLWSDSITFLGLVSLFLTFLINTLYNMGTTSFALKAHDQYAHVTLSDLWRPRPFWSYAITNVLYAFLILVGLVLFIIPGIVVSVVLSMSLLIVVDTGASPYEALQKSYHMTAQHKWDLFVLGILILGINILGALVFVVGLLVSMPVSLLAVAHAYRVLSATHH